jgi:hydroxyacylglutathione hydrolase
MNKDLIFAQLKVGNMENFSYVFADANTKQAMLVDPAFDQAKIMGFLEEQGLKLEAIVLTHHHFDHINEAHNIKGLTGAKVYAHPMTTQLITVKGLCDENLNEGDVLELGTVRAECLHTPGHTPGGICLIVNGKYLVTGDTLFVGNCGRIDLLESSPKAMMKSLARLKELPDELIVCAGHDYGPTPTNSLGNEKTSNPTMNCEMG